MAQVKKVFLIRLFLARRHAFPFVDEVLRCKWHERDSLCSILQENPLAVANFLFKFITTPVLNAIVLAFHG
jgi:hypothetical protein